MVLLWVGLDIPSQFEYIFTTIRLLELYSITREGMSNIRKICISLQRNYAVSSNFIPGTMVQKSEMLYMKCTK